MSDPHDEIIEQLPEDFVRRMRNWVRGRDGAVISSSSAIYDFIDNARYESRMPVLIGEAQDTDAAVRKLPQRYQEVIAVFWFYEARTIKWMATATPRLRLWKLGQASFIEWLELGHEHLHGIIARMSAESAKRRA